MKIFKSITLLIVSILFNITLAYAGGAGSITSLVEGKSIILSSNEQTLSEIEVRLSDMAGEVLIREEIQLKELMNRKYNLRKLPDGIYELQIIDEQQILTKRISIDKEDLSIIEETKLIKPRFFMKNNVMTVSLLPFGEKATIRVYDDAGIIVVEENFKNEETVSKKYDFSSARIGNYKIVVMLKGEVFRHPVNIFI